MRGIVGEQIGGGGKEGEERKGGRLLRSSEGFA